LNFNDGDQMRVFIHIMCFLSLFPVMAEARQIQIIHTNDLHSYFAGYNDLGGYPRVLTKIKEIRATAEARGIEVLQVDAGDWGDGTAFFLSDQGADSIRALELLGIEVSTIGNHDHMSGGKVLGDQIRRANVKTKFVAANVKTTPEMELEGVLTPYADLEKGGVKLRIIGLTTSSDYFEYSMRPGSIDYSVSVGEQEAKKAKSDGRELVIALTHIGLSEDKLLAQNSSSISLLEAILTLVLIKRYGSPIKRIRRFPLSRPGPMV
jgi:2',3'-cyclic-nucleotide 2'-phosphodiesterase (5'-nucleotidase family)